MGIRRILTATQTRPADNTAYTAGDHVANSGTGSAVLPMTFQTGDYRQLAIHGARCTILPASGNVVITALDFDLLLFKPSATTVPFAAGSYPADNAAFTFTQTMYKNLVAAYRFVNGAWRNQLGALTAGTVGHQSAAALTGRAFATLDNEQMALPVPNLIGCIQILAAWTPTGILNTFDFALDVEFN